MANEARVPALHWFLLGLFTLVWLVMAWRPHDRADWLLENYLVFATVPVVLLTYRRWRLDDTSYALLTLFMVLHVVGSHWTYARVPLIPWEQMGFGRNHYDRLVHFAFGFLLAVPLARVFVRAARVVPAWGDAFSVMGILAFSAVYEVIEWLAAEVVAPGVGQAFLGTQGDEWDAIKDMALAGGGALLAVLLDAASRRAARRKQVAVTGTQA